MSPNRFLPVLALSAVLISSCAVGHELRTSTVRTESELRADLVRDFFIAKTTIDGQTFDMLVDTGAGRGVLDEELSIALGYSPGPFQVADLGVGVIRAARVPFVTHDMSGFSAVLGRRVDGILPFTVFENATLVLDYPARAIRVGPPGTLDPADKRVMPTVRGRNRPFIELAIDSRVDEVLVDSGAGVGLALTSDASLAWRETPRIVGHALTIHGLRDRRAGRLDSDLLLGNLHVIRPHVEFTTDVPHVGTPVLRNAVVSFDSSRHLVRFDCGKRQRIETPSLTGSGLTGVFEEDGWRVLAVYRDSASDAGVRVGDLVVAIDGHPVANKRRSGSFIGSPTGEKHTLGVRRGDESLEMTIDVVSLLR